jgi:hypothetical protein
MSANFSGCERVVSDQHPVLVPLQLEVGDGRKLQRVHLGDHGRPRRRSCAWRWLLGSHVRSEGLRHRAFGVLIVQALAPGSKPGCRGIEGPVPPPLWMSAWTVSVVRPSRATTGEARSQRPDARSERRTLGDDRGGRRARLGGLAAAALGLIEAEHRATSIQTCGVPVDVTHMSLAPCTSHGRRLGTNTSGPPAFGLRPRARVIVRRSSAPPP